MTPGTLNPVPAEDHTPRRTVRIPDTLWQAASAKARERGETLTSVIVRALERYVRSH